MNIEELVQKNATDIIENTLKTLLAESYLEVKFNDIKKDHFAVITFNDYIEDKEYSIQLHKNNNLSLVVGYYDEQDDFHEVVHALTTEELEIVPDGVKKVMKKVLLDEEGLRVPSQLLVNKK